MGRYSDTSDRTDLRTFSKKGTAEWKDIIADAVGIALGAVLTVLDMLTI